ncbi:hypothetical protein GCM10027615_14620 [Plantactinospora veratri]
MALLLLAMVVVAAYAATAEANLLDTVTFDFWVPIASITAVFLAIHVVVRFLAPYADPVLVPAVALVNGLGVAFLRRLDLGKATPDERADLTMFSGTGGRQLAWTLLSVALAAGLLVLIRDHRAISRYAYTLVLAGIVLVITPALLPAKYSQVNPQSDAKLWISFGGFTIQPGEFAKLALLVFFAYYLVRKREVLSLASRRFLGVDFPRGRDLGPVIVVWLISLAVLVFQKDLGTSLLYFGMFVVTLYIATERVSWLIIGLLLFFGGAVLAWYLGSTVGGRSPASTPGWTSGSTRTATRTAAVGRPSRDCSDSVPVGSSAPAPAPGSRRRFPRCTRTSSSPAWVRRSACSGSPPCWWSIC